MLRTPPKGVNDDAEEPRVANEDTGGQTQPPSAKLGVVTKKQNEIESLLLGLPANLEHVKTLFTEYLVKVENLYEASKGSFDDWLLPHNIKIAAFRKKMQSLLYPEPMGSHRKAGSSVSEASGNTARLKLAERKSKLLAQEKVRERKKELDLMKLKLKHMEEELSSKEAETELALLEKEINGRTPSSVASQLAQDENNLEAQAGLDAVSNPGSCQNDPPPPFQSAASHLREPPLSLQQDCLVPHRHNNRELPSQPQNAPPLDPNSESPPRRAPREGTYRCSRESGNFLQSEFYSVLQRQNDLTEQIMNCHQQGLLPKKEVPVFDGGDITKYKYFIVSFDKIIDNVCKTDSDRFHYLQQYTSGKARRLVDSCCYYDQSRAYAKARTLLQEEFDDEFKVSNEYLAKLDRWPSIKAEDIIKLEDLSLFLMDCENYMENMSIRNQLQSPQELMKIVTKLPYKLRERWRRYSYTMLKKYGTVYFRHLVEFVKEEVSILKQPLFGQINDSEKSACKSGRKTLTTVANSSKYCEYCKKDNHNLSFCRYFAKLSNKTKSEFIRKSDMCYGCLQKGHISKNCTDRLTCSKCSMKHPSVLHDDSRKKAESGSKVCSSIDRKSSTIKKIIFPILPVKLKIRNSNEFIIVNCALDNCSSDCFINESLLPKLNLKCQKSELDLTTMTDNGTVKTRVVNNLQISDIEETSLITVPVVYTRPTQFWPFTSEDLIQRTDIEPFSYLRDVPLRFEEAPVDVLIGMNVPALLRPFEVVQGGYDEPYATKHLFGWALNGPVARTGTRRVCNRISVNDSNALNKKVEDYMSREYLDTDIEKELSFDDKKWMSMIESTVTRSSTGGFEIGLPFTEVTNFPDNKSQIYGKFLALERRLKANASFYAAYDKFMQEMIEKDFVEIVPIDELKVVSGNCWYLNHHGVVHKVKNKLRVVFNCSLKYRGISLNDNLCQGPDLTNSLFGVLLRFRQEPCAIVGDIQKMFYQVKVPSRDSNFMRFFWYDHSKTGVTEYRLKVHVFGATSSPSVANYALKQTVVNSNCSEDARTSILNNFYVDDLLKSVSSESKAINLLNEIRSVLAGSKFKLTGFNSNSDNVLAALPVEDLATCNVTRDLPMPTSETSRALGVIWQTRRDTFSFHAGLAKSKYRSVTKRELLQNLASVYDPLGLISPSLVEGKKLFQESCRLKLNWDDPLPSTITQYWNEWLESICKLDTYEIPRCLKSSTDISKIKLNIFADGSEVAYGCVAYTNFVYESGEISSSLLASKSRLTPLNNSTLKTVPRIELCSAKLAVEFSLKLVKELEYKFSSINFWTDSTTVLSYITNDSARFHRFVANKVAFIRNFSASSQWFYVQSKNNPADIISRGATPTVLKSSDLWNYGPDYLCNPNFVLPQTSEWVIPENDSELRVCCASLRCDTETTPIDKLMTSMSDFYKLKVRIGWLVKFINTIKSGEKLPKCLSLSDLENSETIVVKYLQNKYFSKEIAQIKKQSNLTKTSPLRKLAPFLDIDGIVRVGGRIAHADIPFETRHPVILPKHLITELLVKHTHRMVGHCGRDNILSNLRKKYWVINGNSMARRIVRDCTICRKLHGKSGEQIMADLPLERVRGDVHPFTHTGVDYFGPFIVSHGRKNEKRWGVVFSCFVSRAIHLEISHSLNTDSFLNCLRRFVARRGNVISITSDNGTNLVGGQKDLKKSITEWNEKYIQSWFKQRNIVWNFNSPAASHYGGAFEREIRSIRKVLNAILLEQNLKLNDDNLNTLMCEVEAILNNRPLTEVNDDPNNMEALTPNHILLFRAGITFPPGLFTKEDHYVKRRWRQVQYLTNVFWKRWKQQYLVLLQRRQRWQSVRESFNVNDLVLVIDVNTPRSLWPLGRIIEVFKDKFNHVRTVKVKMSKCRDSVMSNFETTILERPIVKLIKLRSLYAE